MATLDDLLTVKTAAVLQDEMLTDMANPAVVGGSGLPTLSWQVGSMPRVLLAAQAEASSDMSASQRAIAAWGFLDLATGDALTLHAYNRFDVTRDDPVATIGIATLTEVAGGPGHVVAVGDLIAQDSAGHQYRNITGGTLAAGASTLMLRWQATETGAAWNVGNGSITTLVTALASTSVANPATWVSLPGTVASATQGTIRITDGAATGPHVVGAGTMTVSDGGGGHSYTNSAAFTITTAGGYADVLFTAVAVGFCYNVANNTITTVLVTPVAGLTSNNPATTWITTSGADQQTDASVRAECRAKWATLGVGWTSAAIEYLAKQAATSTPVTRVRVVSNPGGVAGLVGVTIASVAGVMGAADVAVVTAYFAADRTTLTSSITVASAAGLVVAMTGTIRVPAAYLTTTRAAAERNLVALETTLNIGGNDDAGNVLEREDLIACLKNAIYDSDGNNTNPGSPLNITLTAPAADTAIAINQVVDIDYSALVWTPV